MNLRIKIAFVCCGLAGWITLAAPPAGDGAGPHPNQPVLLGEHRLMLNLVKDADVTHQAVADGIWSDAKTWRDGIIPPAGAVVLIPKGRSVTLTHEIAAELKHVRVDGRLEFSPAHDTALLLDTLLIAPGGQLVIGSEEAPIAADKHARITFTDSGPIDTKWDPTQLSRGLISHGAVTIHGAKASAFLPLAKHPKRGDSVLQLSAAPAHWRVGDRLILPGAYRGMGQDEDLKILEIAGDKVTVSPLKYDHLPPADDLTLHVAHLTRNVIFSSKGTGQRGGHIMFMHSPSIQVANAAFIDLGRTDKSRVINDPVLDASGAATEKSGANPRGRYAIHMHRTGTDAGGEPARVTGCVVTNSPGWGFVNHSSNVIFEDNVAYNVLGSAFVTEAGDEIGAFRRNIAIRSKGSGEDEVARTTVQDFGHEGDGFWFQGPGIAVEDNIAAGQAGNGFIFFTQGLRQDGLGITRFAVANLADQAWVKKIPVIDGKDPDQVKDAASVPVIKVPITNFRGNIAYDCQTGFKVRFHAGTPAAAQSVIADSVAWNTTYGAQVRYTSHLVLRNLRLVGGFNKAASFGVTGTLEGEQDIYYENLRVEGYACGIHVPEAGHHTIVGGYWKNAKSILVPTQMQRGRTLDIKGDVRFGDAGTSALHGDPQYDIYLQSAYAPMVGTYRDANVLFAPEITRIDIPGVAGKQLYYSEQAATAIPFKAKADSGEEQKRMGPISTLPAELIGKTSAQLSEQFGLAIAGATAPASATTAPRIHGLIGDAATYPPERQATEVRTPNLQGYKLTAAQRGKKTGGITDGKPTDLKPGWNLITTTIEGVKQSFLIFGGEIKPYVQKPAKY